MSGNRKRYSLSIVLLLVLGLAGCRTVSIPEPTKNPVPPGMSLETVRALIVLSIDPIDPTRQQGNNLTTTSEKVLREVFAVVQASNKWSIEGIEPGAIRAGTTRGRQGFYVAVKIHFTEADWWVVIVDGSQINFDGERIHKNALM